LNYFFISKDILLPLIKLGNTFQKGKRIKKGFFLFNCSLIFKRAFKLFIKQVNYPKIKEVFLKHIGTYTGPLDPHVSLGS
jgi:hypothetical protein